MKLTQFDMMRVWAMATGLILCAFYFGAHYLGFKTQDVLPMLITGIGGFELFHFVQDLVARRRRDA